MTPESRENIILIKKEVLNYLSKRNFGVYAQSGYYRVEKLDIAKNRMPQEKYYEHNFNNKLRLLFSSELFFPQQEYLAIFEYLYNNTTISKEYLLDNVNDLTDGFWKKDMSVFLNSITDKVEEKQSILLGINNVSLSLNTKNIKQIHDIFKNIHQEDKIKFWVKFFNKRKKALNGNKGGSETHKYLTSHFTKDEIKEHFINISPYIKDLFENTVDVDIFKATDKYQQKLEFDAAFVEKALKIPGFNKKKIAFELPRMMIWLSSIMGYNQQLIANKGTSNIQFIISSNESLNEELFKQVVKDYLVYIKNNDGKTIETQENFAKWYMKNKLDNKLIEKDIKVKVNKI